MADKEHSFCTSYVKDAKYGEGLRDFFEYRDLGVAGATGGQFRAHVMRVRKGSDTSSLHTTGLHRHELGFQMIYILKGWVRFVYEDHGEHTFGPGDSCLMPPDIVHNELECSDDLELLEINSPAKFKTVVLDG